MGNISDCIRRTLGTPLLVLAAIFVSAPVTAQTPLSGAGVTGTIVAKFDTNPVALPDIQVTLVNRDTGAATASVMTDLNGRFGFPVQPPGTYRLCWQASGWTSSCLETPVVVGEITVRVGFVSIAPQPGLSLVYGTVKLADGTPCRFSSPFFGIDLTAHVSAVNGDGKVVAGPVHANTGGQYVLAGLPQTAVRAQATCDRASVGSVIGSSSPGAVTRLDIFFQNSRPQIGDILPTLGGHPVRRVPPGTTVDVAASVTDIDGDAVFLSWKTAAGSGVVRTRSDGTAKWVLPGQQGLDTLYLLASDGKGGIRQGRLTLNVGPNSVFFSGLVTGPDNRPIGGASVNVNDNTVTTGTDGVFSVMAAGDSNDRYVVTVTKTGYVPQSRIYNDGAAASTWHLLRAQVTTVDPQTNIDIQAGGVQLQIGANSLVDENGNPPGRLVNIALATLDPDTAPLPGNDGGIIGDRQPVSVVSTWM